MKSYFIKLLKSTCNYKKKEEIEDDFELTIENETKISTKLYEACSHWAAIRKRRVFFINNEESKLLPLKDKQVSIFWKRFDRIMRARLN